MLMNSPVTNNVKVYYHMNTTNPTFLAMVDYLEHVGIKNNKFFMVLFDPDLYNINPFDPNLNGFMCTKIAHECMINYWYFIREVVRIPDQGSSTGGNRYRLDRGNLALNFCLIRNMNIFIELPRQFGKTISICVRLLWEYLYGTSNTETMIINKKHADSKLNLQRIKDIRDALPPYLQMKDIYGDKGKKIKKTENVESISNPLNNNKLVTMASARNKIMASQLGRGCTQPRQWYDEYAFIPFNREIYNSATPAFSKASENAKRNNAPYGIILSTTPGILTTDSGIEAYSTREVSTKFSEAWYDMPYHELVELLNKNTYSTFVHIRYTYKQLGAGEDYLARMIKEMKRDYPAIRRECLLEWAEASDNSPFTKEELDIVKNQSRDHISTIKLCKYFDLHIYEPVDMYKYPPLIGVDVAGGLKRDSSAITIVDSKTTRVVGVLNCNYISPDELAACIVELVSRYAPTAVVNVERNGGFGASVVHQLMKSPIKQNLYYEIKDKVIEERFDGTKVNQKTVKTRIYGIDSTKRVRDLLMEILRQRMTYHKDKFVSPILYEELAKLEVKKSGKIEHSSNGHDDQLFSYLLALYIWYEGVNLRENWGITKGSLQTDENVAEEIINVDMYDKSIEITDNIKMPVDGEKDVIAEQEDFMNSNKTYSIAEWKIKQFKQDEEYLTELLSTPQGRKAYCETKGVTFDEIDKMTGGRATLPNSVYNDFYGIDNTEQQFQSPPQI